MFAWPNHQYGFIFQPKGNNMAIWYCIFIYCAVCWLVGYRVVRIGAGCPDAEEQECAKVLGPVHTMIARWLTVASCPIWFPLVLAFCLPRALLLRRQLRVLSETAEQFRPPMFEPVDVSTLEEWIGEGFEQGTAEFIPAGFEQLGDYFNKPDPIQVYNRYFIGRGGTIFGSLTAVLESCGAGLYSILEDGTYVETAAIDSFTDETVEPEDLLHCVYPGERPIAELIEIHQQALCEECEKRQSRVLALTKEQLAEVTVYGAIRFHQWRGRLGDITGDIPAPVIPAGKPVAAEQVTCKV